MRFLFTLVILGLLVVGVVNGAIYLKYGKMPLRDWVQSAQQNGFVAATNELIPAYKKLFDQTVENTQAHEASKPVKIYKWTDANGRIHYDNKPVKGAQSLEVDPNSNVVSMEPVAAAPVIEEKKPTMKEEMKAIEDAKRAHFDALAQ